VIAIVRQHSPLAFSQRTHHAVLSLRHTDLVSFDEVTVKGEEHSDAGTFTLDETVTPKRMTIKSESGPNKGKTFLAIYEIKSADAMRVCYDLSGKQFPKEFKAPKDTELYLVGYRRQKSEAAGTATAPDHTNGEFTPNSKDE